MKWLRCSRGSVLAFGTQVRGSNPAEAVGFFGRKNPQRAFLRSGSKAVWVMSCFTSCKRTQNWRGSRHFGKTLVHFSPIVPPSAAGFASVASDAGDPLWRKLERSKSLVLLQVGGFDVPLATAFCNTFLLRTLNDSWAGRNPTKGCSADWRRIYIYIYIYIWNAIFQATAVLHMRFSLF
jgi:hypothetical protein